MDQINYCKFETLIYDPKLNYHLANCDFGVSFLIHMQIKKKKKKKPFLVFIKVFFWSYGSHGLIK